MLKTLELRNCFVHKHLDLDFQKGLTTITGPNWSGKSLILEMVQYALWGSCALRGKAEDYKGLQVTLVFEVHGIEYTVRRSSSTVRLLQGEAEIASGIKAVNPHVQSLFGYGYNVFTMANAINQGKIEELGNMLPTARKKLVDQTIGLDRMDGLGDWIVDTAREIKGRIQGAEKYLSAPVMPDGCPVKISSEAAKGKLGELQGDLHAYQNLSLQADVVLEAPEPVVSHKRLGELKALEATQGTRQVLLGQQASVSQALRGFPAVGEAPTPHPLAEKRADLVIETEQVREAKTQKIQIQGMLKHMLEPTHTLEQVEKAEADAAMSKRWLEKQLLLGKLAEYVCPACDHHWHDENPQLKLYEDVPRDRPTPELGVTECKEARKALEKEETRKELTAALALLNERLEGRSDWADTIEEIDAALLAQSLYKERLAQEGRRLELVAQLNAFVIPEDQSKLISDLHASQKALDRYDEEVQAYNAKLVAKKQAMANREKLPKDLPEQVAKAMSDWNLRSIYESEMRTYETAQAKYEALLKEVEADRQELAQWDLCKQAVATLRQRVKGYLLPSLNKVASHLLQTMTSGGLSWVVVSEEFDITVDGQRIETLSGAGKSIANLALRIGLGQVLTNKTFSVLMLDEIDASCDDPRAAAIAESLQRLTGQIGQIVQVSHKQGLVADHYVRLGT